MNWQHYFNNIRTKEEYELLRETGMMWEFYDCAPSCWQEHEKLYAEWRDGCWATNE